MRQESIDQRFGQVRIVRLQHLSQVAEVAVQPIDLVLGHVGRTFPIGAVAQLDD